MAWPDSDYPTGIDAPPDPDTTLDGTPLHSELHLFAHDAIEKIETQLGANPSGSESTVAARFTTIEGDITTIEGDITTIEGDITAIEAALPADGCICTDVAQSIPNSSLTSITFGTEGFDTNNYHGPGGAVFTFQRAGWYIVTVRSERASGNWSTGYMRFNMSSGGNFDFAGTPTAAIAGTAVFFAAASATLTPQLFQAAGGAVNVDSVIYIARLPYL